ncbi:hypothetical protein D9C73_014377 [Collichthys lucidus]|uniref:Uncharacterized protein n=1 Tax=Collichthys lucidus TaxID=240159 RepID=A0A4U5UW01_COLLU|nr:hypothetical protein D9C73_014377 [Collichthys lucidus]
MDKLRDFFSKGSAASKNFFKSKKKTPEDPKNTQPNIPERARSCLKNKTNDKVVKSSEHVQFTVVRKLFYDVPKVMEEQIDEGPEVDMWYGYNYKETVEALPEKSSDSESSDDDDDLSFSEESEISVEEDDEMLTEASLEEALERNAEANVNQETVEALPEEVEEQRSVSGEDDDLSFSEESEISVEEDDEMLTEASLEEALERDAEANVNQETVEALPEEVEEQRSVSGEDDDLSFSEESEISVEEDDEMFLRVSLQEALKREAETKVSLQKALEREAESDVYYQKALERIEEMYSYLQEALEIEAETNVSLQKALEREAGTKASLEKALEIEAGTKASLEEALKKEEILEKTLREAEAEKDDLRAVIDLMKAQVADLMNSQMSHEKQKHTITAMPAELDESKKLIIELQKDLEASTLQHEKEMAEGDTVNCAQMKLPKEHLIQQQEKKLLRTSSILNTYKMMHSLSKMAAARYFPSIHDNTSENETIWAPVYDKPQQLNSWTTGSTKDSSTNDAGANKTSLTTQQTRAKAAWLTLAVPDYQPLDVFSVTAGDPGPVSWSEEDEICELAIRLKEIELCDMIRETSGIPECK